MAFDLFNRKKIAKLEDELRDTKVLLREAGEKIKKLKQSSSIKSAISIVREELKNDIIPWKERYINEVKRRVPNNFSMYANGEAIIDNVIISERNLRTICAATISPNPNYWDGLALKIVVGDQEKGTDRLETRVATPQSPYIIQAMAESCVLALRDFYIKEIFGERKEG